MRYVIDQQGVSGLNMEIWARSAKICAVVAPCKEYFLRSVVSWFLRVFLSMQGTQKNGMKWVSFCSYS